MIGGARTQAVDARTDTLGRVPSLGLGGSCRSVANRRPVPRNVRLWIAREDRPCR